ncbi:MAG: hypothetical protein EPN84_01835 [Legionella sp.]|nr:MAG: hypothetical protein EPN84_01835 [Legionella sp.]
MSRLHQAVACGDIEKVKECLAQSDDINEMSSTISSRGRKKPKLGEMTPLHLAAYYGHTQIAELLVQRGAKLNLQDSKGKTAMELAIFHHNLGLAKLLKQHGAIDKNNAFDNALASRKVAEEVYFATRFNKPDVIREIYAEGLLTKEIGENALIRAARYNSLSISEVLVVECGMSVNALQLGWIEDDHKTLKTPLGVAAEYGHTDTVEFLLAHGAEVDKMTHINPTESEDGTDTESSPTQLPELNGRNIPLIRDLARSKGCTPLFLALQHEESPRSSYPLEKIVYPHIIHYQRKPVNTRLIEVLLTHRANFKKINDAGFICLALSGFAEELEILLRHGLDPNLVVNGIKFIDICLKYSNRHHMAVPFVAHGADISSIDEQGQSYLHKSCNLELSKALVGRGVVIELTDNCGRTAIEGAATGIAEFLARSGASIERLDSSHSYVFSSPLLIQMLLKKNLVNFTVHDAQGFTLLGRLVTGKYFETMKVIMNSGVSFDINQVAYVREKTVLHLAFEKCVLDFLDPHPTHDNLYTQMIDLLISHGAKPLKDREGKTPLMGWVGHLNDGTFNPELVRKFCSFEANYYGVSPEVYERELMILDKTGFYPKIKQDSDESSYSYEDDNFASFFALNKNRGSTPTKTPLDIFWEKIEHAKVSQIKNEGPTI